MYDSMTVYQKFKELNIDHSAIGLDLNVLDGAEIWVFLIFVPSVSMQYNKSHREKYQWWREVALKAAREMLSMPITETSSGTRSPCFFD